MSTQSPNPPTPKGPRNNRRNSKRNMTPSTQKVAILATPPSSPPRNSSPGGTATDSSINVNASKKKNSRSGKKPRDASKASPAPNGHRHTTSQPNNTIATPQVKDSPHYAGPTFHASPAPSALPIPSFFSKSLPESDLAPTIESDGDHLDAEPDLENTPSKPKSRPQFQEEVRQSTPLDFLFKAAVEARNPQQQQRQQQQRSPEASSRVRSPQTDSKTLQHRRPNGTAGGLFRMEMESPEFQHSHIGPSFATPYKDRMNALRSASSPSPPVCDFDEQEKRAKTEALKTLLLNPRPQRPSSASITAQDHFNPVMERPASNPGLPHFATPVRTTSGPPASISHGMSYDQKQTFVGNGRHYSSSYTHSNAAQQYHLQNSPLRKEVLTSRVENMPSVHGQAFYPPAAYDQPKSPPKYAQYPTYYSPPQHQSPVSRSVSVSNNAQPYDTKKIEDDLRRILKLDVNPTMPANGMQSSFA
ncbi:proline-rich nuclear receptor coactivator motif-containing protein [Aspergillus luchuensis]|uniref:Proteophosphoglycan 5 n=2 Tax=Aspergillus kawachii TaxID=1069201 RepID=A0A1M3T4S7_ASPLC|nr:uncharacterized protein AKAW2_70779A [Aspergillus luchuensis]OJZ81759.1 hypothetical protein ASPFODRAFT_144661 [Aspergillus luchuensis CBS 106.47]GAA89910.1 similar to An17g02110 [Aspergillus luchuensis IFO 4308]BCS03901.1 hypothetical protein AKAW2_70779A [Aspergillus luchuensis]BCS15514.1 hypothetical protein ALUC_70747A [Aspergillus luchuensis]GAT30630.1 similar to An17g02110 [Aspergillus luchuensis]